MTTVDTDDVAPDYKADVAIIIYEKSHAVSACVEAKISHPR